MKTPVVFSLSPDVNKRYRSHTSVSKMLVILAFFLFGKAFAITKLPIEISVAIPEPLLKTFVMRTQSIQCHDIKIDSLSQQPSRGLVELIIACKALHKSGVDYILHPIASSGYQRSLLLVASGQTDLMAESVWEKDIDATTFHKVEAVIESNQTEKGIYTLPEHPLQQIDNVDKKLINFVGVSRENWVYDWAVLNRITTLPTNASTYRAIFSMLKLNRADFTLHAFSAKPDFSVSVMGINLIPIEGVKVAIKESRHFVVSKRSPRADILFNALNNGVKELKKEGTVHSAFSRIGYFNPRVKNWKNL